MKFGLTGLIAAPFTAMNGNGSLNLSAIESQAQSLVQDKVSGVFICGTTGEGLSLTTDERIQIAKQWITVAFKKLKIIVHVGHNSLEECQTLAENAQHIGADAIAAIAPPFFRPANVGGLVDYCAKVAAAASKVPFYYYHIPVLTGVDLPMPEFLKLAADRIPNFAGIKFTDENLMDYMQCLNAENGSFNILFGRDEILLAGLALGAPGAVGTTYNFMAPLYHRLIVAFRQGDLDSARRYQSWAIQIIAIMIRHGGLAAGKAMMKLFGIDCGPVRSPLRNPSQEEFKVLAHELQRVGFPINYAKIDDALEGRGINLHLGDVSYVSKMDGDGESQPS